MTFKQRQFMIAMFLTTMQAKKHSAQKVQHKVDLLANQDPTH